MDFNKFSKNVLKIFKNDLKSLKSNKIVMITIIAIIILPSLYALLNIAACWNPYESTSNIQFAIVNEDVDQTYNGKTINFGNELVNNLNNNTQFDWQFVDIEKAKQGVDNGSYAAVIIIPADFTSDILSVNSQNPKSAELEYIINQKTNPVSSRMCDSAAKTIMGTLNSQIVATIDVSAFDQIGTLQSSLASGSSQLASGASQVSAGAGQVSSGASQVSSNAAQINEGASEIEEAAGILEEYYGNNSASELARASSQLAQGSSQLASGSSQLASGSNQLASSSASALSTAASSLSSASSTLSGITGIDGNALGEYFAAPVEVNKTVINEVENYGSEVSPFYLVLSVWVGCLITCVMVRPRYAEPNFTPLEMYFGKMGLFMILAILETTVTILGSLVLGIQIENILLFAFSLYFISLVFMMIVYTCISVFGNVGKAIVIILLLFQISSTGGIYPVEVMADFFKMISPYLPMTYAISMMREASLGLYLPNYLYTFSILLAIGLGTLIIGSLIKDRFDERANYFEKCLEESGLF